MLQTQCLKVPVKPGKEAELKAWVTGLNQRQTEVQAAIIAEGINDEAVFFSEEGGQTFMYMYSRSADLLAANAAFESSEMAVDVEFKHIMLDCLDLVNAQPLKLLFAVDAG